MIAISTSGLRSLLLAVEDCPRTLHTRKSRVYTTDAAALKRRYRGVSRIQIKQQDESKRNGPGTVAH